MSKDIVHGKDGCIECSWLGNKLHKYCEKCYAVIAESWNAMLAKSSEVKDGD